MRCLIKLLPGTMFLAGLAVSISLGMAQAQSTDDSKPKVTVTIDNFIHADSTRAYLKELAFNGNKVNFVRPNRDRTDTDNQDVIRMNDDTLYTRIILDVKGGATITLKDYEGYQNANVIDINHSQIASLDGAGTLKVDETMLTEGQHAYVIVRTGLLRGLPRDEMMKRAYEAQDNISITYNSSEPFAPPVNYDLKTIDAVKYKLFAVVAEDPGKYLVRDAFGTAEERDTDSARVMIAVGWGAMAGNQAAYSPFSATREREVFTIDRPNLKYDQGAFFSFTIYNEQGWIATKKYAINSDDMTANPDGTYTVTFLASGEPVVEGDLNVVRTPRGRLWTGVLRAYAPVEKIEVFDWVDAWTSKMNKAFAE